MRPLDEILEMLDYMFAVNVREAAVGKPPSLSKIELQIGVGSNRSIVTQSFFRFGPHPKFSLTGSDDKALGTFFTSRRWRRQSLHSSRAWITAPVESLRRAATDEPLYEAVVDCVASHSMFFSLEVPQLKLCRGFAGLPLCQA